MSERIAATMSALGGMNQDSSLLKAGEEFQTDYRYARNVRIGSSIENNTGDVENLPSTLEINTYLTWNGSAWISGSAPAGTNVARGEFRDKDEGALYWAVYNSNGNHQILKFVKAERQIYEILQWTGLNFGATNIISMAKISDFLILTCKDNGFNDVPNPPRCMDTTSIYDLKITLGSSFSEYHISFAKWPPLAPPVPFYNWDGSNMTEGLRTKLFQFSYRYVFVGGFKSTWSPPSFWVSTAYQDVDITKFILRIAGFTFDYETPTNTGFANSDVRFYSVVEFIEFGFRESDIDPWKFFKRLSVGGAPVSETPLDFTNDSPSAIIAQKEIGRPFDSVPFFSGACEAIDNRPMLADNVDDLEAPVLDISDAAVYSINPGSPSWLSPGASFSGLSGSEQVILETVTAVRRHSFKERGIYVLGIIYQHFAGRTGLVSTHEDLIFEIPVGPADNDTGSEQLHALGFKINHTPPETAVAYQIVRSNCLNIDFFIEGYINNFKFLRDADNGISDAVQTPEEIKNIQNDFYNASGPTGSLPLSLRMLSAIRKSEEIPLTSNYAQRAGFIYMEISNWVLTNPKNSPSADGSQYPTNNLFYNFQKGDRVRFRGSTTSTLPVTSADLDAVFDEEIVEFTGQGIIVKRPITLIGLSARSDTSFADDIFNEYLIEIYRPKKFSLTDSIIYYESGEWYPITQPGTGSRAHSKTDFTWVDPATVTVDLVVNNRVYQRMPFYDGDVHVVNKDFYFKPVTTWPDGSVKSISSSPDDFCFAQMTQDPNNAAGVWHHNNGRPLVAYQYPPVNLTKLTQVRFGGRFLEDSIFVSINEFLEEWQFIYPSEYGRIRRMINTSNAQVESVGNVLLILGEQEAWSVYVNRTTLEDLSGKTQVAISDRVLGSFNTLLGSQGTLNPESAMSHNGRVLWWNAKKGTWNRYSRDGITEISSIEMKNWFKDLSDLLINAYATSTPPRVISTYDNYHDEWVTRFDHSSLPATFKEYESYKCISFAERNADKRWKSVYDFAPDLFSQLDNEVYSIIGSKVHIHEAGVDFGKIYGSTVPTQIELVMAEQPRQVKFPLVVIMDSTDGWSFERIIGDRRSNGATVQETRIPLTSLELKEGVYWAEIKRDKNSPNASSEEDGVVNGNPIKTKSLRFFMQLDPAVDYLSVLSWLSCEYDTSPKNPKI